MGRVDTDLVIVVGNKCSGFVTLLLVTGFLTKLAETEVRIPATQGPYTHSKRIIASLLHT